MEEWKQRLTLARHKKGIGKSNFATAVGVKPPTVTGWEKSGSDGGIKEISGSNLARIAELLDVDATWILTGKGKGPGDMAPQREQGNQIGSDETARLALEIQQLSESQRSAVTAVVTSLRGASALRNHDAEQSPTNNPLDEYERRMLDLLRQLDDRARGDAEDQLRELVREHLEFTSQAGDEAVNLTQAAPPPHQIPVALAGKRQKS